jgi:hypothetical protein
MGLWQVPVELDGHRYVLVVDAVDSAAALEQLRTDYRSVMPVTYRTERGTSLEIRWRKIATVAIELDQVRPVGRVG